MGAPLPQPSGAGPPRPPSPPAPPATGDPGRGAVDPRDPGPPIVVQLGEMVLGDLGHPRVDARALAAITLRGGDVAQWLAERGIDRRAVAGLPGSEWSLGPPPIPVSLNGVALGDPGSADADARLLTAILLRGHAVGAWLSARGITVADVERDHTHGRWD